MKKITVLLFFVLALALVFVYQLIRFKSSPSISAINTHLHEEEPKTTIAKTLSLKATTAKKFIKNKPYNEEFCFLIDMKIRSGSNRFFVYDLKHDSVIHAGVVTHGRCNERWLSGRKYGNEPGCGCTSLGKYKIGNPYIGRFGLAYKLYGLDSTNSNAFRRYVVLHAHDCVPPDEVFTEICQSDGCPTVSPGFLKTLQRLINSSEKPVLLWIYE